VPASLVLRPEKTGRESERACFCEAIGAQSFKLETKRSAWERPFRALEKGEATLRDTSNRSFARSGLFRLLGEKALEMLARKGEKTWRRADVFVDRVALLVG
jgi:hypothetical protein